MLNIIKIITVQLNGPEAVERRCCIITALSHFNLIHPASLYCKCVPAS